MHLRHAVLVVLLFGLPPVQAQETCTEVVSHESVTDRLDPDIAAIMARLPRLPAGAGRPIGDRFYWNDSRTVSMMPGELVPTAERLVAEGLPPWDDAAYLEFSQGGTRPRGEAMMRRREAWLTPLVLAECREDRGRFLVPLQVAMDAYLDEPSWVLPAHDPGLLVHGGRGHLVDLRSAVFGANLAQALYLVGDRLDPALVHRVRAALRQRILDPVITSLRTGRGHPWLGMTNNWNSVCLAGVLATALAGEVDLRLRATLVQAAACHGLGYLRQFREDGYCDEGGGYWTYGFTHFTALRELLLGATQGSIDLLADPKARSAARFGRRFRLTGGLMPAFADSAWHVHAPQGLNAFLGAILGIPSRDDLQPVLSRELYACLLRPTLLGSPEEGWADADGLRSYFADAGVLVSRPDARGTLGVAIKGGGNSSHSHDDVGSYVITQGDRVLTGDPGGPRYYPADAFAPGSHDRYRLLNSFGHPLPLVAGARQRDPRSAGVRPRILARSSSPDAETITIDLATAYAVPALRTLTRRLTHVRQPAERIAVADVLQADAPIAFGTAVITRGTIVRLDADRRLLLTSGNHVIAVDISASEPFVLETTVIEEMGSDPFTRIGIDLREPAMTATITCTFGPVPP